jgi:putative PLP-dependent aminotransferase (TIGR04422 family)
MRQLNNKLQAPPSFLWPKSKVKFERCLFGSKTSADDVEATLLRLYPDAIPVLFSSARAGLSAILQHLHMVRSDIVWCPPYSSHCVLEAIARYATPSTTDVSKAKVALIYHQWGFVHRHELPPGVVVIEDAVDTLFLPGANIFACNGRFALWSLPKVIASSWGGVVFCQSSNDAKILRAIRAERSYWQGFQAMLRMVSDRSIMAGRYWHGSESMSGGLPEFAVRQVQARLGYIPAIAQRRGQLLDLVRSKGIYFPMTDGRLPSNIPLIPPLNAEKWWGAERIFSAGIRTMNVELDFSKEACARVAPLPVHQNVSEAVLNSLPLNQYEGLHK